MRLAIIDRLVYEAVARGFDAVIDLSAGRVARPHRLALPPSLLWIEAQLPELSPLREKIPQAHIPHCTISRVSIDLSSQASRRGLLLNLVYRVRRVLVITEDLLPHIPIQTVAALAADLRREPMVQEWIVDYAAGSARSKRKGTSTSAIMSVLHRRGWEIAQRIEAGEESARLERASPQRFPQKKIWRYLPSKWRDRILNASGVFRLKR